MNTTNILDIFEKDEKIDINILINDNESIFNGDLDLDIRKKSLERLFKENNDLGLEYINSLTSSYSFQPSTILQNFLVSLIDSEIDVSIRLQIVNCIYLENPKLSYPLYYSLLTITDYDSNISILTDSIRYLFETDYEFNNVILLFTTRILLNLKYEHEYRYKILLTIQRDTTRVCLKEYLNVFYYTFAINENIPTRYKILSSQYILQNKITQYINEIEDNCMKIMLDNELDYNLRADCADMILRLGTNKEVARDVIIMLGRKEGGLKTIYNDSQNVHVKEVDQSVKEFINKLSDINLPSSFLTIEDISIKLKVEDTKLNDLINSSILRINMDQTLYEGTQTLRTIFLKVWYKIQTYPENEQITLIERVREELIDMANTCSSGHLSRLVNIFSGFEYSLNIGFREQIKNNLFARLLKLIKDIVTNGEKKEVKIGKEVVKVEMTKNELEDYQSNILDQLSMNTNNIEDRKDLMDFFRRNLLVLRDELYNEFVPKYVDENIFEESIRSAIIEFENNN